MNPLLAVLAYHPGDVSLVKNLLSWIRQLGGCPGHSCLLIADEMVPKEERLLVKQLAIPSFANVDSIPVTVSKVGYAPNHMFLLAAQQVMFSYKLPWLWLEPDCVPLKPGWLSTLSEEYAGSPKRLLGGLIESTQPGLPAVHLTGVSIYPPDVFPLFDGFESLKSANVAWDMEAASATVPRAKNSAFMNHLWGQRDLPPTFVKETRPGQPINAVPLSSIKADAVIHHRCKDGTLINLLREALAEKPEPAKRGPGRPPKQEPVFT